MRTRCGGIVLAVAVGLLLTTPARAPVLMGYLLGEKLASPTFNLGFEIGLNFSTLDGLDGAERTKRTVFGLFSYRRFSEHFHLAGALLPFAGRGAEGATPTPTGDAGDRQPGYRWHHEAEPELPGVPRATEVGAEAGGGFPDRGRPILRRGHGG